MRGYWKAKNIRAKAYNLCMRCKLNQRALDSSRCVMCQIADARDRGHVATALARTVDERQTRL